MLLEEYSRVFLSIHPAFFAVVPGIVVSKAFDMQLCSYAVSLSDFRPFFSERVQELEREGCTREGPRKGLYETIMVE